MNTHNCTCDYCQKDITYTTNCKDYRIQVRSDMIPPHPERNTSTAMEAYDPLPSPMDFCSLRCLAYYAREQL
jgi:hypothetical protein